MTSIPKLIQRAQAAALLLTCAGSSIFMATLAQVGLADVSMPLAHTAFADYSQIFTQQDYAPVAAKAAPAIVSFYTTLPNGTSQRIGTGFIISPQGYILTAKHVVANSSNNSVQTSTGSIYSVEKIYIDSKTDAAIVKIAAGAYPSLTLGDSSRLERGQNVISHAPGVLPASITNGTVLGYDVLGERDTQNASRTISIRVVQTSSQFYNGYSGSPLLDTSGKAVGINIAVNATTQNASFSVPINDVLPFVRKIIPNFSRF